MLIPIKSGQQLLQGHTIIDVRGQAVLVHLDSVLTTSFDGPTVDSGYSFSMVLNFALSTTVLSSLSKGRSGMIG